MHTHIHAHPLHIAHTYTGFPRSWKILEKIAVMESHGKVLEYENFPKRHGEVMELLLLMLWELSSL